MDKVKLRSDITEAIQDFPVIDCHDHTMGPSSAPEYREPITALIQGYVHSDLASAGGEPVMGKLNDQDLPTEEKWPIFERIWRRTQHTAYARVTKLVMRDVYGEDEMNLPALKRVGKKLLNLRDEKVYAGVLDGVNIKCRLVNVDPGLREFISGERKIYPRDRLLIPLPGFHSIRNYASVENYARIIDGSVTDLDDYLDACKEIFSKMKEAGAVGFKDQSAYSRTIRYDNTPRCEAEKLFNFMMEDPRRGLGWPEAKPLDDFLFHAFMKMARELDLPVQIHTGHMAGVRNDIVKTNAANFTSVLELHSQVKFDLFHGNWPYLGELLYLAKNFPNAAIDCCWVNIIDPFYTEQLMANSIVTVPHSKIHGFGADYGDCVEYAAAHLQVARDVIAGALARSVRRGWLPRSEVENVAADWLFNNPNEFFALGFAPFEP
jgi:predicted TIM-barrel fold metal-dependent hydrolase